ncbi:Mur ligase family protein, partial [Patescibacteria group bacterium]
NTKYELIQSLPEQGLAIFNGENKYCKELYRKTKKPRSLLISMKSKTSDIRAQNIKITKDFIFFKAQSRDGQEADFKISLLGAQNIENILLAVCCAKELGMSLDEISKACEKIEPWQGGIVLKRGIGGVNIIDATYSSNPNGVISHLEYLKPLKGKKIIIMPCLIELGPTSKEIHKKIGKKIGQVCDLAIITTKEFFFEIKKGAVGAGMKKDSILFLEKPEEIFEKMKSYYLPENTILLESRVPNQLIDLLI